MIIMFKVFSCSDEFLAFNHQIIPRNKSVYDTSGLSTPSMGIVDHNEMVNESISLLF